MQVDDMIMVSVDDHVVEPPDMFEQHLADKWKSRAPRVVRKKDGCDVWLFEGAQIPNIGLNAVAGRPREEYGVEPTSYDQLRRATWDVDARIDDMNANGVLASMCFPSFPSFAGQLWANCEDKELALVMLRAYNDWHVDEWCGSHPGRFIPLAAPILWNPDEMGNEIRRLAKKGCHAISFSENPTKLGFPSLHDHYWDPLWRACSDEGTSVCIHIGSGEGMVFTSMDSPVDVMITVSPINVFGCAADLVWSRVLRDYPDLSIVLSEGGIGWIPYLLERMDYVYDQHHLWTHQDFAGKTPSQVFREHITTCFIDDKAGVELRHHIGVDNITWECDYPHSDSTWPHSPESLARCLEGVPDDEVNKISFENALRVFRLDPFATLSREECTVAALRARAGHVDLEPRSQGGNPPVDDPNAAVTSQHIIDQLSTAFASPFEQT